MKQYSFSRPWHRLAAGAASAAIVLTSVGSVAAQDTHYTDVPAGVWYEEAAAALLNSGALDESESRLRPNDLATRAEVLKLLVNVYGEDLVYPATPSFSDVPKTSWYYPYVEASARAGWVKGDSDCYGEGMSRCTARPGDRVNRAEMATLLQRAYRLSYLKLAPEFTDNSRAQWYHDPVQTAADHCILEGDSGTSRVRPAASMNRAEMVVIMHRASQGLRYGDDCGAQSQGSITSAEATSSDVVRVTFSTDLDSNRIDDIDLYTIETSGGTDLDINDINVLSARSVEIDLGDALDDGTSYRVMVDNMRTERGVIFDDSQNFTFDSNVVSSNAEIDSVTVRDADTVRVRFSENVTASYADDASRYMVARTSNDAEIIVNSVAVVDGRTVDLNLKNTLAVGVTYRVEVADMRADDNGDSFDDSMTFSSSVATDMTIQSVAALSSTRLRVTFSEDVDETRAEDDIRYRLSGSGGDIGIDSVGMTDGNVVEIVLDQPLQAQQLYMLNVTNLLNADNQSFSDDITFVYGPSNVSFSTTLNGAKEVPLNASMATGTGTFTLTSSGLQYDITLKGLSGSVITGGHFHRGAAGVSGPVVEPISVNTNTLRTTGTWTDLTAGERDDLLAGRIYVNIHTNAYPNGEIRGQVTR